MRTYKECPQKFYLQYLLGTPQKEHDYFLFGTKFHQAIAKMNEFNRALYGEEITRMVDALRADPNFARFTIKKFETKVWAKMQRGDREYKFFCILDAVATDCLDGGREVTLEFKSSDREWVYTDKKGGTHREKLDENILQHSVYAEAVSPQRPFFYFIVTKHARPRVQFITPDQYMTRNEVLDACDKVYDDFEFAGTAYREAHGSKCMLCDYRDSVCPFWF